MHMKSEQRVETEAAIHRPLSGIAPCAERLQLEQFLSLGPLLLDEVQERIGRVGQHGAPEREITECLRVLRRLSEAAQLPGYTKVVSALAICLELRAQGLLPLQGSDWLFLAIMTRALETMLDTIARDRSERNCCLELAESTAAVARYQPLVCALMNRQV
ncbi:MAG: hypothetical protein RJA70_249 [Pseudomonadota bacterium]|jgi:hypothetical protein